jgi:hypothetical protein
MHGRIPTWALAGELLEQRCLLSAGPQGMTWVGGDIGALRGQVIYLDFDGAQDVTYRGPRRIDGIDVPAFNAGEADARAVIKGTLEHLRRTFAGTGVVFTARQPEPGTRFSTIYVGGGGTQFARYGNFLALAEKVDAQNQDRADDAFVFSDRLLRVKRTSRGFATVLHRRIAHEAGHLLGWAHDKLPASATAWDAVAQAATNPAAKVLDIPFYNWWYGCAPTAVGVAMGYWDGHGFDNLIPGDASTMTDAVKNTIASTAHIVAGQENKPINPLSPPNNPKYYGWGDWHNSPSYPNHETNPVGIADHLRTVDGISYMEGINWGTGRWLASRGQTGWTLGEEAWGAFTWQDLVDAINAGRPVLGVTDSDGDGTVDHLTVMAGYDVSTGKWAAYDSVAQQIKWQTFGPVTAGVKYGIASVRYVTPPAPTVAVTVVQKWASEAGKIASIQLTRSGGHDLPITVKLETLGNAVYGVDYKKFSRYVTFAEGESSKTIQIIAKPDDLVERTESVIVRIVENGGYQIGWPFQAKVQIIDAGA